jgi:hypothetical protein
MDSELDDGTISWGVNNGAGQRKDSKGKLSDIPFYNAAMLGSLTMPYIKLAHALQDSGSELSYVGLQSIGGTSFHQIKLIRHLPKGEDPKDSFAGLRSADYYLSSTDLKIIGIIDKGHPNRLGVGFDSRDNLISKDLQHALYFSDFREVNGVLVPFSITEELAHQRMWSIQLTDISFNTGLGDLDFTLK